MTQKRRVLPLRALAAILLVLALAACNNEGFSMGGEPELAEPNYVRTPPGVPMWEYTQPDMAQLEAAAEAQEQEAAAADGYRYDGPDGNWEYKDENYHVHQRADGRFALLDFSHAADGYVVIAASHQYRVRLHIMPADVANRSDVKGYYRYEVPNDGTPTAFPLSYGSANYNYMVYMNVTAEGSGEAVQFIAGEASLALQDEFGPYLVPNGLVNYTPNSPVVQLAHQITRHCSSDVEVLQQIYYWVTQNIVYDIEKAEAIKSLPYYIPNLDDILNAKTGICFDYAALIAAMLRANGIPCKMVFGDANADGEIVYHAWNDIWMEETGWITIGVPITPEDWQRIDTTFAASGQMGINKLIGDGKNYLPRYYH